MIEYVCPVCGSPLEYYALNCMPPINGVKCTKCEWKREEREAVQYLPYPKREISPCDNCPNHPANGGSGVCFCTLGSPVRW